MYTTHEALSIAESIITAWLPLVVFGLCCFAIIFAQIGRFYTEACWERAIIADSIEWKVAERNRYEQVVFEYVRWQVVGCCN